MLANLTLIIKTDLEFLVEVNEDEWQGDVERSRLEGTCRTLASFKGHHKVDPACRLLTLQQVYKVRAEDDTHQLLKLLVHACHTHTMFPVTYCIH